MEAELKLHASLSQLSSPSKFNDAIFSNDYQTTIIDSSDSLYICIYKQRHTSMIQMIDL